MNNHLFIDIHTHREDSTENSLSIQNIFLENCPTIKNNTPKKYSVGLHPWHIKLTTWELDFKDFEKQISTLKNIKAIGETGLDRSKGPSLQIQQKVFQKHIELSEMFKLPIIIHCVKAWSELLQMHNRFNPSQRWIVHGFNQNLKIASQLLEKKIFISFGKALMNGNSNSSRIFPSVPLESVFLETDDSDYTINEIYETAAKLSNNSIEKLSQKIQHNFNVAFSSTSKTLI